MKVSRISITFLLYISLLCWTIIIKPKRKWSNIKWLISPFLRYFLWLWCKLTKIRSYWVKKNPFHRGVSSFFLRFRILICSWIPCNLCSWLLSRWCRSLVLSCRSFLWGSRGISFFSVLWWGSWLLSTLSRWMGFLSVLLSTLSCWGTSLRSSFFRCRYFLSCLCWRTSLLSSLCCRTICSSTSFLTAFCWDASCLWNRSLATFFCTHGCSLDSLWTLAAAPTLGSKKD